MSNISFTDSRQTIVVYIWAGHFLRALFKLQLRSEKANQNRFMWPYAVLLPILCTVGSSLCDFIDLNTANMKHESFYSQQASGLPKALVVLMNGCLQNTSLIANFDYSSLVIIAWDNCEACIRNCWLNVDAVIVRLWHDSDRWWQRLVTPSIFVPKRRRETQTESKIRARAWLSHWHTAIRGSLSTKPL